MVINVKNSLFRIIALCLVCCISVGVFASCGILGNQITPDDNSGSSDNQNNDNKPSTPPTGEDGGEKEEVYSDKGIFFSSNASDDGDGTIEKPYNSLETISELTLEAGSYIYIEKGSVFYGSLAISNAHGTDSAPIVVTSYGKGAAPIINGNGLEGSGVIHIANCSNIVVENLEITDSQTSEGDRRGVLVSCDNNKGTNEIITYKNITLNNLYIHDINGFRDAENSGMAMSSKITGGIHLWSNDGLGRVDGFVVTGCTITEVSNVGIATWHKVENKGNSTSAKMISPYNAEFENYAHKNVHIDDNEISHIGKNAIFARNLLGGLIEHNVVHDTAKYCVSGNSIVTRSVDGTVIQYNEGYRNLARVRESDGKLQDGCMLDADLDSKFTIWQYNYSHDNSFGLFLNCTNGDDVAIVRYNLSVNDKGNKGVIYINYVSAGIYVYNNTIVTAYDTEYIIQSNSNRTSFFYNNIIYNRSATAKFVVDSKCGVTASNNLIYNEYGSSITGVEYFKSINSDGVYDDPMFVGYLQEDSILGIGNQGTYMLDSNSPALGVGKKIEEVADFFGNDYKKSLGFYCGK